jgi:hypothetical protein
VHSYFNLDLGKEFKSPPKDEVRFQKCGFFYGVESSFSNDAFARLEYHFEKRSKVFVPKTLEINKIPQFSAGVTYWENQIHLRALIFGSQNFPV